MPVNAEVTISQPQVKLAGKELSSKLYGSLIEVSVENDLHQADVATLVFHLDFMERNPTEPLDKDASSFFSKGARLEIGMKQNGDLQGDPIFIGEVTSIGPDFGRWTADDPWLVKVTAYDKTHYLTRVRESNTYLKQKFSDIAKKLGSERGLSVDADNTSITYDHVIQADQTPWEFLQYMAARVGFDAYVQGDKLYFKKPDKVTGSSIELQLGESLSQFSADASVAFQVKEVSVRGWDPDKQQPIVGKATAGNLKYEADLGEKKHGVDIAAVTLKKADKTHIGNWPIDDQKEANEIAEALAIDMEREHVHAEGVTTVGMPDLRPLKVVEISGVGDRFDGKYMVSSTTHRFDGNEGYTTTFSVGGSKPNSLSALMGGQNNVKREYPGVAIAIVTNIKDTEKLNRVKLMYPWLHDGKAEIESDWARIAVPDAGKDRGFQWLPEINDEVLVAFEHGDINRPYVIGSLWSKKNSPPLPQGDVVKSDKVVQRIIKSRSGHTIVLDDTDGKEQIIINDSTNKNQIVIDSSKSTITIKADKDIILDASGKIDIRAAQAISIESVQQDVTIDCANFKVNAKQAAEISANTNMTLKSSAQMSVEGGAQTAIKGAMVNIG